MTYVLFKNRLLSKDTPQAVIYNNSNEGAVVAVWVCNQGTENARIALATTSTQSLPTNFGEYVDFGIHIPPKGSYNFQSLIIPSNQFLVAYSTRSDVSIMCSGYATGTPGADVSIITTTPATIVGSGLVYHYDPAHLFGFESASSSNLPDVEGRINMTRAGTPTYEPATQSYAYNGATQWWTSLDANMALAGGLDAVSGTAWTVEAWFRFPVAPSGTRTGNSAWAICSKGGGIGGGETYTLYVGSATDTGPQPLVPYYCYIGSRGAKTQISTGPVNDNVWRQVVTTWNGTSGSVYLNGAFQRSMTPGGATFQSTTWTIASAGNGTAGFAFEGSIGPVRVYNRELSAGEVTTNFNYDRTRFGI